MTKEQLPEQPLDTEDYGNEAYDVDLQNESTEVARSESSKLVAIIIVVILSLLIIFFIVFSGDEEVDKTDNIQVYKEEVEDEGLTVDLNVAPLPESELMEPVIEDINPDQQVISDVIELEVPELPELKIEDIPDEKRFSLIPKFSQRKEAESDNKEDLNDGLDDMDVDFSLDENEENKGTAFTPMFLKKSDGNIDFNQPSEVDQFLTPQLSDSSAPLVEATKLPYPERTVAQGKLIDSILETAINTDFEGKVRAIVSRDVFADFGRQILIPKGSRIIGSYSGSVQRGQTRVLINWERLIRPDAIDIQINSPASDQFGRSGVPGSVDNKYVELFNNSILLSLITIGTAMAIEGASGSDGVTEEQDSASGDTTTTSSPSDLASQEIIDTISNTARTVLGDILATQPTITVPHGTRIKIFVNQDLVFPSNVIQSDISDNVLFVK